MQKEETMNIISNYIREDSWKTYTASRVHRRQSDKSVASVNKFLI